MSVAADLFIEYLERRERGEELEIEAFCATHPVEAESLRLLARTLAQIDSKLARGVPIASVRERLESLHGAGTDPGIELQAEDELPGAYVLARLEQRAPGAARYRVCEEVARGGQGVVLRVWDQDLRRNLAMKVMRDRLAEPGRAASASRSITRFLEEALITGQLDHPGIVPVHELGLDHESRCFFVMKLVRGQSLKAVFELAQRGEDGWNQTRVLGVLLKVCEAMAYAHSKGVVHRDLKPANVMVGRFGEVYVMDWGLARVLGREDQRDIRVEVEPSSAGSPPADDPDALRTRDGDVIGTPAYMPPEQARGELAAIGPHSDVYSAGAMLYHLLAGHPPYRAPADQPGDMALWARILAGPPAVLSAIAPGVPAALLSICEKAMARDCAVRYPSMSELADDLRAYLEHRVVKAYQTGALAELGKWVERNRALASSAAAAVLLLVAGLTASLIFKAQSDRNAATATSNEHRAIQGEALATARADDVLRLSALQRLDDLTSEADRLWPAFPENVPKYEDWLKRAQALVDELPQHEAKLADLRAKAAPWTEEMQAQQRASHPRSKELESLQRHLAYLHEFATAEAPKEASAAALGIDWSALPKDANGLNDLAWPLVDPERKDWGGEAQGLALARRAIELAAGLSSGERAGIRDTLAWALLANARFDEAVAQEEQAADEAGAEQKREFEGKVEELKKAIDERLSPEGLEAEARLVAELEAQAAQLEAEVSQRRDWLFADAEDKWWHNQLEKLVSGLQAFTDEKTGLFSSGTSDEHGWGMKKRLAFASSIAERSVTSLDAARRWSAAVASIASAAERPRYGGLRIAPQLGLLPIGRDPDSALWEFAHLQTGEPAERGSNGRLVLKEETGLVFVLLPGGTFTMGAQSTNPSGPNYAPQAASDEGPPHEVTLSPFFLSKYEMTQGQWLRFVGKNPSYYGPGRNSSEAGITLLHPVEQVSWTECERELERLGLLLPSEAQWEYACRSGSRSAWQPGDSVESLRGFANIADEGSADTYPKGWVFEPGFADGWDVHCTIGSLEPNKFGLHEMHGNVWEWCRDGYDRGSYRRSPRQDPVPDPAGSSFRVNRGGGFYSLAVDARSAARFNATPEFAGPDLGLRPAVGITTRDITTSLPAIR